ncbi:MAG: aldehyde ferredoxin oxidoreductase family protein [Candidatus Promineifilaceae bacterium]|nr:aldehyde ferredoxin oxidoreductase family protein [Candidatus Promineifilaceae bacterium]
MIGGTHGKIAHVDLTSGESWIEQPSDDFYRLLVGGRAVVAYLLLRDLPPGTDPLSPDNLLIFAPGIMQGTNLPGSGRHGVGGKSPLTGAIASSEAGGWWGHEFKRAGFDVLVVRGRAESPVYLWIKDGEIEIRPADHLWGQLTHPVEETIRAELEDQRVRVAQIGPAGENQVKYAAIMHDVNRAAGRNGLGALMGAKRLKAVAVRGTVRVSVAERKPVIEVAKWLGANYEELVAWAAEGIGRGTQDSLMGWAYMGGLPVHNFGEPVFENPELLSGERNYEMFLKERDTCQACPITCKQVFEHESDNPYQKLNPEYGGPEYEAMAALGPNCGVEDNLAVSKANELANANGLDVISTGMSIAFVMECFERGILTAEDTGGLEFRWGDADLLLKAVELIARREDFGDILAEGVARMSQRFGPQTAPFALTVKGQELPMHEPRLKHVMGVGYAVAPVGADHMMNVHDTDFRRQGEGLKRVNSALPEGEEIAPLSTTVLNEDKLRLFYHELNWMHFQDCAVNCHFYPYDYAQFAQVLSGVTGLDYSLHDILDVGARAQTLARLFNLREGLTAEDDKLPKRVRKAFKEGPIAGKEITVADFEWAKRRYYELMDWDPDTAEPSQACLQRLELDGLLAETSVPAR